MRFAGVEVFTSEYPRMLLERHELKVNTKNKSEDN